MDVVVHLFGPARDALGAGHLRLSVPMHCTCADLLSRIREQEPVLLPFTGSGRLAVNHAFARPDQLIRDSDELALISMVSGG